MPEREFPFRPDLAVFKVGEKMFALSALSEAPLRVSVKCDPELSTQLAARHVSVDRAGLSPEQAPLAHDHH